MVLNLGFYRPAPLALADLPGIHKDPFDRILIAQAKIEGLALLTADATLARYGAPVEVV